ncbi:MAG: penicillin-binding protein [Mangrovicoccus sp.]|nr:penicillin-binding protein [Mangrovicoccus sp.]
MSSSGGKRRAPVAPRRKAPSTRSTSKASTGARKSTRRAPRRKQSFLARIWGGIKALIWRIFRLIWGFGWRLGAIFALILGGFIFVEYAKMPPAESLLDGRTRGSVTMLDRDNAVFAWRGDQFGGVITPETVSPHLKHAILATEDRRFYRHFGVSPRGVAGAMAINLREGRSALSGHGGSTITQQAAKLLCIGRPYDPTSGQSEADYEAECRKSSLERKAREAIYAMAMEAKYSKDEILAIYMNRAYLGAGTRGFEAASQRYFGKSAANVTPSEAAMLAGLLVAPTRYAPTSNLKRSRARANTILGLMHEEGYLDQAELADARANPASLSRAAAARTGGAFADWIMESAPSFLTSQTTEDVVIKTSFDPKLQRAAEAAMEEIFATKVRAGSKAQAAIVVMSADGAVRAMVGGRDTRTPGSFNRATQALRQTGSAFKPFVYATALEMGYSFNDFVDDAPLTIDIPGSGPWSPRNYSRNYRGVVTFTEALKDSLNIPAVKISEAVGRENVRSVAAAFGIKSDLAAGPALALGASEATLLEVTGAYAGILNGGSSVTPYGLRSLSIVGDPEPLLGQKGGIIERVISPGADAQLVYMLNQVIENGTGRRAQLDDRPAAGKTGTTQASRDAWFVGFTADYVAGVWMGYDDNSPLKDVTGGGLPAEIWRETMLRVHEGLPVQPLPMTDPRNSPRVARADMPTIGMPGAQGADQTPATQELRPAPLPPRPMNPLEKALSSIFRRN